MKVNAAAMGVVAALCGRASGDEIAGALGASDVPRLMMESCGFGAGLGTLAFGLAAERGGGFAFTADDGPTTFEILGREDEEAVAAVFVVVEGVGFAEEAEEDVAETGIRGGFAILLRATVAGASVRVR